MRSLDELIAVLKEVEDEIPFYTGTSVPIETKSESFSDSDKSNENYFEKENDRIEKYLSEFTNREGVLLTISGLFTLLPFSHEREAMVYFLTWVIPFLIVAIVSYVCSSKRTNIIANLNVTMANRLIKEQYGKSLFFHRITNMLLVSFFVSFLLNYYLYVFLNFLPSKVTAFLVLSLSLLLGSIQYLYTSRTRGRANIPEAMVVGCPAPNIGADEVK